jgi:hypothetical protein
MTVLIGLTLLSAVAHAQDPLPSWSDGKAKQAIVAFVAKVTKEGAPDFVPPAERIATFDNDGTLWAEQPMLELLAYLRANGFKTFIVSGGGIEFMRPWVERVYGVPPEQVIGSSIKTQFEWRDGRPVLVRLPEVNFIDDKTGKPVGINEYIGRCPIAAFGNSDGDLEMLQWTTAGRGARLALIVHHTDAEREWAYDRTSAFGRLDKALDEAQARGWTVVSMKDDWKRIFPFGAK